MFHMVPKAWMLTPDGVYATIAVVMLAVLLSMLATMFRIWWKHGG